MKERKQKRMVDRIARNKASRNIGIATGSLLSLFYVTLTYSTSLPFCIDYTPQFFGGNSIFKFTVAGGVEILCALGAAILMIYALVKMYIRYLWVPIVMLIATAFVFAPPYRRLPDMVRNATTKQNLGRIHAALYGYTRNCSTYPVDIYTLIGNKDLEQMPVNAWADYKMCCKEYTNFVEKTYKEDTRTTESDLTSRFGIDGRRFGNVSTGYDIGRELIPWWDAFSEGDKPSKEQKLIRGILVGNFVYLPCDEARNPIQFSEAKTIPIKHFYLIAFGTPTAHGIDIWTPTGDPDMPIKLERDGKPDGVIIVLEDEE